MDNHESLADILRNPHFNQFASLLSVAMSLQWRMAHPGFPSVRSTIEAMLRLIRAEGGGFPGNIKIAFVSKWTELFVKLVENDEKFHYSTGDMDWFIALLDGDAEHCKMVLSMLFAVSSSKPAWYTAEQVATITGQAQSTWRNKAAGGQVIGARKEGKTWVIPSTTLRAYGIDIASAVSDPDYAAILEAFLQSEDFKAGVISSTRASWHAESYSVELFPAASWEVQWTEHIGAKYESPGIILRLPTLSDEVSEEYFDEGFANEEAELAELLREKLREAMSLDEM